MNTQTSTRKDIDAQIRADIDRRIIARDRAEGDRYLEYLAQVERERRQERTN